MAGARNADRTAATFEQWLAERVTQVAVAWVLATVFVRFCEDNGLIEHPFIAGPGDRADQARELQEEYFAEHPDQDLPLGHPGVRRHVGIPGRQGPVRPRATTRCGRSSQPTTRSRTWWRSGADRSPDGHLVHDFTDADWDTRFLGDLYQDLSEDAREDLRSPADPGVRRGVHPQVHARPRDRGVRPRRPSPRTATRTSRTACASSTRPAAAATSCSARSATCWRPGKRRSPATDKWKLINEALGLGPRRRQEPVRGGDRPLPPDARRDARGRRRAPERAGRLPAEHRGRRLTASRQGRSTAARWSSIRRRDKPPTPTAPRTSRTYIKSVHILAFGSYHVVVANPPYITVRDEAENERVPQVLRELLRQYSLSVPFAERIFKLAIRGYVGLHRPDHRQLVHEARVRQEADRGVLRPPGRPDPRHRHVRCLHPRSRHPDRDPLRSHVASRAPDSTIRAVLGVRGEPGLPDDPRKAPVWQAIVTQVDQPGSESEWVSVVDLPRELFREVTPGASAVVAHRI